METEVYTEIHSKKKKTLSFALGHQAPTMCISWRPGDKGMIQTLAHNSRRSPRTWHARAAGVRGPGGAVSRRCESGQSCGGEAGGPRGRVWTHPTPDRAKRGQRSQLPCMKIPPSLLIVQGHQMGDGSG